MFMEKRKLTVFLSHSHKDEEKVKKVRDLLELIGCEPLIFFFKCLDDDNEALEDFIKREIEARNVFLYCKSENSEKSVWVQKELEYIRSFDKNRLYVVDLDDGYGVDMVKVLNRIVRMIAVNRIFIDCSPKEAKTADAIAKYFDKAGMQTTIMSDFRNSLTTDEILSTEEFFRRLNKKIEEAAEKGIMLMLTSDDHKSSWYDYTVAKALSYGARLVKVVVKRDKYAAEEDIVTGAAETVFVDEYPTKKQLDVLYSRLIKL